MWGLFFIYYFTLSSFEIGATRVCRHETSTCVADIFVGSVSNPRFTDISVQEWKITQQIESSITCQCTASFHGLSRLEMCLSIFWKNLNATPPLSSTRPQYVRGSEDQLYYDSYAVLNLTPKTTILFFNVLHSSLMKRLVKKMEVNTPPRTLEMKHDYLVSHISWFLDRRGACHLAS